MGSLLDTHFYIGSGHRNHPHCLILSPLHTFGIFYVKTEIWKHNFKKILEHFWYCLLTWAAFSPKRETFFGWMMQVYLNKHIANEWHCIKWMWKRPKIRLIFSWVDHFLCNKLKHITRIQKWVLMSAVFFLSHFGHLQLQNVYNRLERILT